MAKSIPGQSSMFDPPTSTTSSSVISSPASAGGPTPSSSPAGPPTDPSGPGVVPANRGAWREQAKVPTIRATFGRPGSGSSQSDALQRSLENRLRVRMASTGSILFTLTWKRRATPSGRSISLRRASARRTGANGSGSWPTTTGKDAIGSRRHGYMDDGRERAATNPRREILTGHSGTTLSDAADLAAWPTPTPTELGNTLESYQAMKANMASGPRAAVTHLSQAAQLAAWASPQSRDHKGEPLKGPQDRGTKGPPLNEQARLASWPTPQASEGPNMSTTRENGREAARLTPQSVEGLLRSGTPSTGSPAETAKRGRWNPAHSRWLMGYPPVWDDCAGTAMPSSRKSPRK